MSYTPKQLREWVEFIGMDEYDYRKPSIKDVSAALEAFADLMERHAELEKIAAELALWCVDSAAEKAYIAWRDK